MKKSELVGNYFGTIYLTVISLLQSVAPFATGTHYHHLFCHCSTSVDGHSFVAHDVDAAYSWFQNKMDHDGNE